MDPSLAIILLNYKRPQNIGRIAIAARTGLRDATILVLDQAETADLRLREDIPWADVWYRRAANNTGAGARVPLAAAFPFDRYIAVDDDVFLRPEQLAALAAALDAEPDRAHGVMGQRLEVAGGELGMRTSLGYVNAAMSMLNGVYAFSRAQAEGALALASRLGWTSWSDVGPVDDILLSCGLSKPPLCHDLGPLDRCPSSDDPAIAVWRTEGFGQRRRQAVHKLLAAQAIAVFTPLERIG